MLSATMGATATVEDVRSTIGNGHVQVADYIADNVPLFAEKYREEMQDDGFDPTEIEFRTEIRIVEEAKSATFLDFDGDNGYLLLADDYELLDFSTTGQLEWDFEEYSVAYSRTEGYCYYDDQANLIPFARKAVADQEGIDISAIDDGNLDTNYGASYNGQMAGGGSGAIYSPDTYIASRYGSGYKLKNAKGNMHESLYGQGDFSVYTQIKDGVYYSEGNCVISACYLLMKELMDNGKYKMSYANRTINPTYDPFYYDLMKNPRKYGVSNAYVTKTIIPLIYSQLRDYFIKNADYTIDGVNRYSADNAINAVGKSYGYNLGASITSFYSFDSCVKSQIDKGKPSIWFQFNGYYAHHAVLVNGYRTYEKVSKWWIFKTVETHNLMMINDNWTSSPRFIDYEQLSGSFDGLFGSFLRVK